MNLGGGASLRLIWKEDRANQAIKFLYVDQRDDYIYARDLNALPEEPCYQWNGECDVEWSLFINSKYHTNPILTAEQKAISNQIATKNRFTYCGENPDIGFFAHIIQSPPGTGKTVVAALRASELYREGWNVVLLVPQALSEEIQSLKCIQESRSHNSDSSTFFCGTFHDWLRLPTHKLSNQMLSTEEELEVLKELATRAEYAGRRIKAQTIQLRDLILYHSFVLNDNSGNEGDILYQDNQERIQSLELINTNWWFDAIKETGKISRSQNAESLVAR